MKALLTTTVDKALVSQEAVAVANIARLRRVHPNKTPAQLVTYLNRVYLGAVTATGAGAGAAAIVPNGVVQAPVAVAEMLSFLEVSVLYTLSIAAIHGVDTEDAERRKLLVMVALIGNSGTKKIVDPLIARTAPHLGKKAVQAIPMAAIDAANKVLGPRFITKYGTKQGVLVLGKQVPVFIGVAIGAGGNYLFGRATVAAVQKLLGGAPESWNESSGPVATF